MDRQQLTEELKKAIAGDELELHLQPQINAHGLVIGAEALLRWKHPKFGMIPPGKFIPIAEKSGLIVDIGNWVIKEAARWMQEKTIASLKTISINISLKQFEHPDFSKSVIDSLLQHQLKGNCLILELSEEIFRADVDSTITKMQELAKLGINFSVADLGTGYASLAYLMQLPVGHLKFNTSFVSNAKNDPNEAAIVDAIICMAKHLKLDLIIEGVEAKEQFEFFKSKGGTSFQGYLFCRPLATRIFSKRLKEGIIAID